MADPIYKSDDVGSESVIRSEHIGAAKTGDNIEAKRVAQYVWDGVSQWVRATASGGSGGTQYTDGVAAVTHPIGTQPVYTNGSGNVTAVSVANPLPVAATFSGSVATAPTFAQNPTAGSPTPAYGLVDSNDAIILSPTSQTKITNGTNVMDVVSGSYGKPALTINPHDVSPFSDGYSNSAPNYVDENFNQIVQGVFPYIFNGSTWDRLPGDKTNGQFVNIKTSVLPTGAATAAKQPSLGTAGTPSTNVLTVQGITSMTALKVDGSGVTQPVSGTFFQATQPVSAASLPLPTGASTSSLQTTGNASLSSIDTKLSGALSVTGSAVGTSSAVVNVGQQTSNTTAVQLSASSTVPTNGIIVQAISTNTASVFVGGSGATTANSFELQAGQAAPFTANLNTLYVVGTNNTDKVCWTVD